MIDDIRERMDRLASRVKWCSETMDTLNAAEDAREAQETVAAGDSFSSPFDDAA